MGGFSTTVPQPFTGLTATPPNIDPYANLRALAMQGQIAQQKQTLASGQQEMQTTALNQQLIQQKITDQQALGQALRDWDPSTPPTTMIKSIADHGGSGEAIAGFQQHIADMQLKNAQAGKATLEAQQTRHDQLASQVQAVIDAKPEDKQALYTQYLPQIKRELDPGDPVPPDVYPGDDWGSGQVKGHQLTSAVSKQNLEKAQAGEAAAKGAQATAEAGKATIEQELTKHKLDLYNVLTKNPQALAQRVADSINPQRYPDVYNRTLNEARNQPDIDHINTAIEKGVQAITEQERTIATETNPQVLQARTNQAVNTAVATETAKAQLSPDIFKKIADPTARRMAEQQYDKNDSDYRTKEAEANRLLQFVQAARQNNQVAAGLIPVTELRSIVNRVTNTELGQTAGGLSVARRLENFLSKNVSGTYSADALNDFEALGKMSLDMAKRTYSGNMMRLKARGVDAPLEPQELPSQAPAQAANGPKIRKYNPATGKLE